MISVTITPFKMIRDACHRHVREPLPRCRRRIFERRVVGRRQERLRLRGDGPPTECIEPAKLIRAKADRHDDCGRKRMLVASDVFPSQFVIP